MSDATRPAEPAAPSRVLVVEDHAAVGRVLERYLKSAGHEVRVVDSEAGAFDAALEWSPDAVLTDIRLREGTGWGLVRALRADRRTCATPIVVVSGRGPESYTDEPMLREADAFLRKPFDPDYLLGVLLGVLQGGGVAARRERDERPAE